jgi:hypothetical protein
VPCHAAELEAVPHHATKNICTLLAVVIVLPMDGTISRCAVECVSLGCSNTARRGPQALSWRLTMPHQLQNITGGTHHSSHSKFILGAISGNMNVPLRGSVHDVTNLEPITTV